ncbi:MAG TPA: hypothetical protein VMD25_13205 [Acidobacteriaceae bacterium]|nr:hypothetical protein [Acidobacteriaceae bacterium]
MQSRSGFAATHISFPAHFLMAACLLAFALVTPPRAAAAQNSASTAAPARWVGTWAASPFEGDPWHTIPTLVDSTLREVVHTSIAGKELRVEFTNEFGTEPLRIDAANIALSAGGSSIDSASLHSLTFAGQPSIVIPPGALAVSDAVDLPTPAFTNLAITFFLPRQQVSNVSAHSSAQQDNYIQAGNEISAPRSPAQ